MKRVAMAVILTFAPLAGVYGYVAELQHSAALPDAQTYNPDADAHADVDGALSRAMASGKRIIVVMGANWCHDSTRLAGWFQTPRFAPMLRARYEVVYVDVGNPQLGHGRNLDIAKRLGAGKIKGTPAVLVLSHDGKLMNKKDAGTWRNAASRTEDEVFQAFANPA
jgi:Thioredoxin-like